MSGADQDDQTLEIPDGSLVLKLAKAKDDVYSGSDEQKTAEGRGGSIQTRFVQPLPPAITTRSNLKLVTDLQTCVKAQANYCYARKVRISNLQKMADTVAFAQEHRYDSFDSVEKTHDAALLELRSSRKKLNAIKEELQDVNEQIHFTGMYLSTKKVYTGYKMARNKDKYLFEHQADLVKFETSRDYLKKRAASGKLPTLTDLKRKKTSLVNQREALYETLAQNRNFFKEIDTMLCNMKAILAIPDEFRQPVRDRSHSTPARPSR